ncbi:MAG: KamA family protein [Thermodesulfobacteriota bacterium]|nr:KamA family protein [Thermodesulfobacteriota bacterium]
MSHFAEFKNILINKKAFWLMEILFLENPFLEQIMKHSRSVEQVKGKLKKLTLKTLKSNPDALSYYEESQKGRSQFHKLSYKDYAVIRILDYLNHSGRQFMDPNLQNEIVESDPFAILFYAAKNGTGGATPAFFNDMIYLFRQFSGKLAPTSVSKRKIIKWMDRYPSGLDPEIIKIRKKNKNRILKVIIGKITRRTVRSTRYKFSKGMTDQEKMSIARKWWHEHLFHIKFAARTAEALNEMLDFSLDKDTMTILEKAQKIGIPIFVNPYYLSLLDTHTNSVAVGADLTIRQYIFYSEDLVNEFGQIHAWEKEDIVQPGKPNAAGWIIPDKKLHRRYPNVAIVIPKTLGRACGGLCSSCQRMYGFQSGILNFDHNKLKAKGYWKEHLEKLLTYFEEDSQLRDILITGGDALMSSNRVLAEILEGVYQMAKKKVKANKERKTGEKYAEMLRVRLGTRLPAYLPMRIEPELVKILATFKKKASCIGIRQFVIQTHFESPMEVTPETQKSVKMLNKAGWIVTNQHVYTSAASRRGHGAKLRKIMNDIGILPYYSFTVKGFTENRNAFVPNARLVQEIMEEKKIGIPPAKLHNRIKNLPLCAEHSLENIKQLKEESNLPFLSTDRNVLNLPGVGKSLTFRTIGITHDGRRILEFDHDSTRCHSPIIKEMEKIAIVESKSMTEYIHQLEEMGENISEYTSTYGYSLSETESRMPVFEYPKLPYKLTDTITNFAPDPANLTNACLLN